MADFCIKTHEASRAYYDRQATTFREIVLSGETDRNPVTLLGRTNIFTGEMEDIAFGSWVFPTLPGTNPSTSWPLSLPELKDRLSALKPLALWSEPFDEQYRFQEAAYHFITNAESKTGSEAVRLALLTTLKMTLNSGSHERIVRRAGFTV